MSFKTFGELNTQLEQELDIEDETFIQPAELIGYWNHAVTVAESHILTLGLRDKYFLARAQLSTVLGQEELVLPSNLYANKILDLEYLNGATFYKIKPLDSSVMFENYNLLNQFSNTDYYRYMITHSTPGDEKLLLVPKARETLSNVITAWYYRSANRYTVADDICDLPAIAYLFLNRYVKEMVYGKESHINYEGAKMERMEKEALMQSVLSGQISDNEMSKMEQDLSAYQESS